MSDVIEKRCLICGKLLDQPDDDFSEDCGGDCLECIRECCGEPDRATVLKAELEAINNE